MTTSNHPVCPKCGEQHPPEAIPRRKLERRVNKLMSTLRELNPEFTLQLLIALLASVARPGNVNTRKNVIRILGEHLGLSVVFGTSPEDLANWKAGTTKPEEVN